MARRFTAVIERGEDDWLTSEILELPGCHTQAKNMEQLMVRTKEAIRAFLESGDSDRTAGKFVGIMQIEV